MTTQAARGVLGYVLVLLGAVAMMDAAVFLVLVNTPVTTWTAWATVLATMAALFILYCVISVAVTLIRLWGRS